MKQPVDMPWILVCRRLPMLLSRAQVKELLGLGDEDKVSDIVKSGLLEARGDRTGKQEFLIFSEELLKKMQDERWVNKVAKIQLCKTSPRKQEVQ
jgi:hypothetical protein